MLDRKSSICMDNNGKDIKHTKRISIIIHFERNGEECKFHKTVWCEVFMQLVDIVTNNFGKYELNNRLGYAMVRLYN